MQRLNIIGCGRVGRTLARLWHTRAVFAIGDVDDHGFDKSRAAVAFIGAGRASTGIDDTSEAELWLLALPDDRIAERCRVLAASKRLTAGNIVFHCSGALGSGELAAAVACGAAVASIHPLKTFADPVIAVATFAGTSCGVEGDAAARAVLAPAFEAIGARLFALDAAGKTAYHAASVLVCNDLAALLEAGTRAYALAGIAPEAALSLMAPLVRETLDNVFSMGTARALTGPVMRGDVEVVRRQLAALSSAEPRVAAVYRSLGLIAVELARKAGGAEAAALNAIEDLLRE